MKLFKCDNCRNEFSPWMESRPFITIAKIDGYQFHIVAHGEHELSLPEKDLCLKCVKKLMLEWSQNE